MPLIKELNLSGAWLASLDGKNYFKAQVPGLISAPKVINNGPVFYKRQIELPDWDFGVAALTLKGARFCPKVYINDKLICQKEGGMAQTVCCISKNDFDLNAANELKIELMSLRDISIDDASRIPDADWWRTNVSSHLWDDCTLNFYKDVCFTRVVPFTDFESKRLTLKYEIGIFGRMPADVKTCILDGDTVVCGKTAPAGASGDQHSRNAIK